MFWGDERAAFETYITSNFVTVPIQYSGVPFVAPQDGAWVRITILPAASNRASLGPTPRIRIAGVLALSIFTPASQGSATARTIADELTTLFREATLSSGDSGTILCRTPVLTDHGTTQDGVYYQVNLMTEYVRDVNVA